jgi:hypothetical protein
MFATHGRPFLCSGETLGPPLTCRDMCWLTTAPPRSRRAPLHPPFLWSNPSNTCSPRPKPGRASFAHRATHRSHRKGSRGSRVANQPQLSPTAGRTAPNHTRSDGSRVADESLPRHTATCVLPSRTGSLRIPCTQPHGLPCVATPSL